ncbi:MAG: hypothetical protein OXI93_22175 [Bryobacterales bacterium]|nr:hypothetical protein [Bryobacterales bacterium]
MNLTSEALMVTTEPVPDSNAGDDAATSFGEAAVTAGAAVLEVVDSEDEAGIHRP